MAAVDDLFTCAICLDWFKSPRRLPCHHVYCLQCLRGLVKDETDHFTCPECRRDHVVPNNNVEEFPVDGRLEQLVDILVKPRPVPNEDWKDSSDLGKCEHSQSACRHCRSRRALLLETLLQESRQFCTEFFTDVQLIRRQKQKDQQLWHLENLRNLRIKVVAEIEDIIKGFETRKLTLLSRIEEEEKLIAEHLSKLDQADTISAEQESLLADLVDKVPPTETLLSLKVRLLKQKELMTSLQKVGQNAKLLDAKFNGDELRKMIDSYGQFFRAVDYSNDFALVTTLNGIESGNLFNQPWELTVCPFTDNVYVTDYTSVRVYSSVGKYIRHIVTNDDSTGLAIDSNQRVIVASYGEHSVKIYNHDLKLLKRFGSKGDKNGQFSHPLGVACDRNDNIYVADSDNRRIQVFTPDGTFLSVIGSDILQNPQFLQISKRQEILVTDYQLEQVVIFFKDGRHKTSITGEGDNELSGPCGICLDEFNRILVSNQSNIQVYNDDGTHHSTISQPADAMTSMRGLAVTKKREILITDYDENKIHRIRS